MSTAAIERVALYVRVSTASKSRQGEALAYDQNLEVQQLQTDVRMSASSRCTKSAPLRPATSLLMLPL